MTIKQNNIAKISINKLVLNLIGKNIEGYKITSILGEGGMGMVYKAYDTKLERNVAIKIMHPRANQPAKLLAQFRKEARHHAKLIHPNIVMVYGLLEYYSFLGIIMEYVEGINLAEMINKEGRINFSQAVQISKQILTGIEYAHSKGFIHRDLKPSNILIDNDGIVKIMDFGISKSLFDTAGMETPFSKIGTVYYMSPEQIKGESATVLSDIYAIGCTTYEMITGKPPFYFLNEFDVMEGHLKKQPVSFSQLIYGIPEWFGAVILKSLDKNPYNRYLSCGKMLDDIIRKSTVPQIPVQVVTKVNYQRKSKSFIRLLAMILLILMVVLITYIVVNLVPVTSNTQLKQDSNKQRPLEQFIK